MLSESHPFENKEMRSATRIAESKWIYQHGSPVAIGFDLEFSDAEFLSMLKRNGITPSPRPTRRHNMLGKVGKKHRTIKSILTRLALPNPEETDLWQLGSRYFSQSFSLEIFMPGPLSSQGGIRHR